MLKTRTLQLDEKNECRVIYTDKKMTYVAMLLGAQNIFNHSAPCWSGERKENEENSNEFAC